MKTKWEYNVLDDDDKESLDDMGREGWELVSVIFEVWQGEYGIEGGRRYYFRRPIPPQEGTEVKE